VGRERILSLQILRFIAAAMVVVFHVALATSWRPDGRSEPLPPQIALMSGVDVFFVISGFIITRTGPLASPRPTGVDFFWRRWSRVAPIYFVLSIPPLVWAIAKGTFTWGAAVATFLFWPVSHGQVVEPLNAFGWTLELEMAFYTVVSLLLLGGRLRRNAIILGLIGAGLIVARLELNWTTLRVLTNPLFVEFGAGVALSLAWPRLRSLPTWLGAMLLLGGFAAFPIEALAGVDVSFSGPRSVAGVESLRRAVVFGFPAASIVAGGLILEPVVRGRLAMWLASAGDASYSIYLSQAWSITLVAGAWRMVGPPLSFGVLAALGLPVAVAIGWLIYLYVEKPLLRDLRRIRPRASFLNVQAEPSPP
jgi:exopolysaccharide production protein ExoZ